MSLDARQLLMHVIRPALRQLGTPYATPAAEQLVLGTAATESSLRWIYQRPDGPAVGLWQMEPSTFRWLRDGFLDGDSRGRAELRSGVRQLSMGSPPEPHELAGNLFLGAAFCRLRYLADPHVLPPAFDVVALAGTWKRVYNTHLGAGTPSNFIEAWEWLIAPWILEA
jgi:hypothetical protein